MLNVSSERDQIYLNILRNIKNSNKVNQRQLALQLGFSLGKLNYCLKELKKKGLSRSPLWTQ